MRSPRDGVPPSTLPQATLQIRSQPNNDSGFFDAAATLRPAWSRHDAPASAVDPSQPSPRRRPSRPCPAGALGSLDRRLGARTSPVEKSTADHRRTSTCPTHPNRPTTRLPKSSSPTGRTPASPRWPESGTCRARTDAPPRRRSEPPPPTTGSRQAAKRHNRSRTPVSVRALRDGEPRTPGRIAEFRTGQADGERDTFDLPPDSARSVRESMDHLQIAEPVRRRTRLLLFDKVEPAAIVKASPGRTDV